MTDQGRGNQPDLPPVQAPARPRRNPVAAVLMVIVGVILLLPGVCSLFFMGAGGGGGGALGALWLICFLISAGGITMIVKAFR